VSFFRTSGLLTAQAEQVTITLNETIPVLLVAGLVTTALILAFIFSSAASILPSRKPKKKVPSPNQ
jgi:ABC-type lipoprotein release transport system permease subunit